MQGSLSAMEEYDCCGPFHWVNWTFDVTQSVHPYPIHSNDGNIIPQGSSACLTALSTYKGHQCFHVEQLYDVKNPVAGLIHIPCA